MNAVTNGALIFLGAGLGANVRYQLTLWFDSRLIQWFPWGTMAVNVSGSLLIGLLMEPAIRNGWHFGWRALLVVGLLGGYTTFSGFSYEVFRLLRAGNLLGAASYVVGTNVLCLTACGLGIWLSGRMLEQ